VPIHYHEPPQCTGDPKQWCSQNSGCTFYQDEVGCEPRTPKRVLFECNHKVDITAEATEGQMQAAVAPVVDLLEHFSERLAGLRSDSGLIQTEQAAGRIRGSAARPLRLS
jgi:hypothetical protein